jgi:malonyl-CoA/methylmalonyl-CoA synthetase
LAGTEVKLTDGDHGELLIKSPTMMIGYVLLYCFLPGEINSNDARYIGDEERTRAAFDDNGFYRTGDLVHQDEQGMFVFDGRVSADCKLLSLLSFSLLHLFFLRILF